jgi:L-ascorbate metabolism protein UlaG (beta-lactamase superfamily)
MAELRWYGHNCFRIKAREATVITDPVGRLTGYAMQKQTADIVTISHQHPGHANLDVVRPEFQTVTGPGEYEMHDVFITGVRTYHDKEKGKERGYNTVYTIELEGMKICHLGDLGHSLSSDQAESLSGPDILLIPVGGGPVIDAALAAEVISQLEPKIVIPMQFRTPIGDANRDGIEAFAKQLAIELPPAEEKLVIRQSDIGETLRLIVLSPDSEAAKR